MAAVADLSTLCAGEDVSLSATPTYSGSGTVSYEWTSSPASSPKPTGASGVVSPNATTTYTVTASVTEGSCTTTATDDVTVTVNAPSVPHITIDASYTKSGTTLSVTNQTGASVEADANTTVSLTANTGSVSGTLLYEWSTSSDFSSIVSTSATYKPSAGAANTSTTYYLRARTQSGDCYSSYSATCRITITAATPCSVKINNLKWTASTPVCAGLPVVLTPTADVSPSDALLSWSWGRSGTTSTPTPTTTWNSNSSASYRTGDNEKLLYVVESNINGAYWRVSLTATANGCSKTETWYDKLVPSSVGNNNSLKTSGLTVVRSGTTLTVTSPKGQPYAYLMYSVVPTTTTGSNPSNLLFKSFPTSATTTTSGTTTVPATGGKVYIWSSSSNGAGCPSSSGTYKSTSITSSKTYN